MVRNADSRWRLSWRHWYFQLSYIQRVEQSFTLHHLYYSTDYRGQVIRWESVYCTHHVCTLVLPMHSMSESPMNQSRYVQCSTYTHSRMAFTYNGEMGSLDLSWFRNAHRANNNNRALSNKWCISLCQVLESFYTYLVWKQQQYCITNWNHHTSVPISMLQVEQEQEAN